MMAYAYEYCVMHHDYPDEPHRGPWPEQECKEWIREAEEEDGFESGVFYLGTRAVGPWMK